MVVRGSLDFTDVVFIFEEVATGGEKDMLADWFARSFEVLQNGIAFGWGGRAVGDDGDLDEFIGVGTDSGEISRAFHGY